MSLKRLGRSVEKRLLRPVSRRLKRMFRVPGVHDRMARLEHRIEELESLFREQAGLHYLRLAAEERGPASGADPAAGRRIA